MNKFMKNVKARWKHFSTVALATGTSIQATWIAFPDDLKAGLGPDAAGVVAKLTGIVLLWGLVGRFIDQPPKEPKE